MVVTACPDFCAIDRASLGRHGESGGRSIYLHLILNQ